MRRASRQPESLAVGGKLKNHPRRNPLMRKHEMHIVSIQTELFGGAWYNMVPSNRNLHHAEFRRLRMMCKPHHQQLNASPLPLPLHIRIFTPKYYSLTCYDHSLYTYCTEKLNEPRAFIISYGRTFKNPSKKTGKFTT